MRSIPPDNLRSEMSFLRTCTNQNSVAYTYHISLLPLETLRWLCVYIVAQMHAH